jgi:fatty-acyl-CoA synthase
MSLVPVTVTRIGAVARSRLLLGSPTGLLNAGLALHDFGPIAGSIIGAARRYRDRPLLIDDFGQLTASELDQRSNALARALADHGLRAGDGVGIMCRNHRGFCDALFASAKLGLRCVLLNTEFAEPQLAGVAEREELTAMLVDDEFVERVPGSIGHIIAMTPGGSDCADAETLIAEQSTESLSAPARTGQIIVLTSGTTGTPKGAPREDVSPLATLGALFDRIPYRSGECAVIGPPVFHALGLTALIQHISMGTTIVLRSRFSPEKMLEDARAHDATSIVVVPVMLSRLLDAKQGAAALPQLRVIFCAGAQLPGPVATRTLDEFGDVLYVLYGSTEVAFVTISTPADHRASPNTVGKPCLGVKVRLFDDDDRPVTAPHQTGRIFAHSGGSFAGYTDGTHKQIIDGLLSSGDVGHFDDEGRLHIDGRDDDMIISGGENVFPSEIEELLSAHPEVADVSVIGVDDAEWGQRLVAFAVPAPGEQPNPSALKDHVREHLARYKVPREVILCDELPRNATGKVLKRELKQLLPAQSGS